MKNTDIRPKYEITKPQQLSSTDAQKTAEGNDEPS